MAVRQPPSLPSMLERMSYKKHVPEMVEKESSGVCSARAACRVGQDTLETARGSGGERHIAAVCSLPQGVLVHFL